jgi:predicted ATPase
MLQRHIADRAWRYIRGIGAPQACARRPSCGRLHGRVSGVSRGLGLAGRASDAQAAIGEAITRAEKTEERWCTAELLRIAGELLLMSDPADHTAAEEYFHQSLDLARRQGALSWELRTATSLAGLQRDQGRLREARGTLASVHDRFSEGFGTTDLKTARQLLDEPI